MNTISPALSGSVATNPFAATRAASDVSGALALSRDRAFTAFGSSILAALGVPPAGSASDTTTAADGRVNGVASALQGALATASGDGVPGLLAQVNGAIGQAADALQKAGYSADAVQGFVTDFRTALSDKLDALATGAGAAPAVATPRQSSPATAGPTVSSGVSALSVRETDTAKIELVTASGAVVRIGLRANDGVDAASGGAAAYGAVSAFASSRFSVSVRGSLSADELKAVNGVLGQVDKLATEFFSGDYAGAFADASTLGFDSKQIARVSLDLTQSLDVAAGTLAGGAAVAASAPLTASATPASVGDATSPPAVTSGAFDPNRIATRLVDYVRQVLSSLSDAAASTTSAVPTEAKLKLLAQAVIAAAVDPKETAGAGLLKATLAATANVPAPAVPALDGAPTSAATTAIV